MNKIKKAIELFKDNPFRKLKDVADQANISEGTLRVALSNNNLNPRGTREKALEELRATLELKRELLENVNDLIAKLEYCSETCNEKIIQNARKLIEIIRKLKGYEYDSK